HAGEERRVHLGGRVGRAHVERPAGRQRRVRLPRAHAGRGYGRTPGRADGKRTSQQLLERVIMTVHKSRKSDRARIPLAIRALGLAALAALVALVAASAWAGSDGRKGTNGAVELQIPVGARSTALGAPSTSDVSGAEATFWNPAGLAGLDGTEVVF